MVELGMAIALGKPTFLFRDDFRRVTDSEQYPLNLMLFTGMPHDTWRDYYYTSITEIGRVRGQGAGKVGSGRVESHFTVRTSVDMII